MGAKNNLVMVRHGQSIYNLENRFTGWKDVGLTDLGVNQAKEAGEILKSYNFDLLAFVAATILSSQT